MENKFYLSDEEIEKEGIKYSHKKASVFRLSSSSSFIEGAKWAIARTNMEKRELLTKFAEWYYNKTHGYVIMQIDVDEFLKTK